MKARELRIGNWVMYDRPCRIHALTANPPIITIEFGLCVVYPPFKNTEDYSEHYSFTSIEDIEPIPITPEILEKAGFRKEHLGQGKMHLCISEDYFLTFYDNEVYLECNDSFISLHFGCKSLHQLQNLYFALTGEELEINL